MKTVKRTLTPEKAVAILAKHGTEITLKEAEIMLDFLHDFVQIALEQQLAGNKESPGLMHLKNNVVK